MTTPVVVLEERVAHAERRAEKAEALLASVQEAANEKTRRAGDAVTRYRHRYVELCDVLRRHGGPAVLDQAGNVDPLRVDAWLRGQTATAELREALDASGKCR